MISNKVSIIIPVFNSESYLHDTLESVRLQSYKNFECLCVDDGSSDKSFEIIESYARLDSRFRALRRPNFWQKGGNACRNYGFELSEGEFIQWFDSDDLMDVDMIAEKVNVLSEDTKLNYVISRTGYFSGALQNLIAYDQNLDSDNIFLDYLSYRTKFFTPGPMFRAKFLVDLDLFDLALKRHQEKEFFFRVLMKDSTYGIVDKVSIFRRMHEEQLSESFTAPKTKLVHEFICWDKIFQYYRASVRRPTGLDKYFRGLFLRYVYRFLKLRELKYAFRSLKNLI